MKAVYSNIGTNFKSRGYGCSAINSAISLLSAIIFCLSIFTIQSSAQPAYYTTQNAHAHNDYEHDSAFIQAYNFGFGSIEADVYPLNGQLMLAHDKNNIKAGYTLDNIYLNQLLQLLSKQPGRKVQLLIDIKENYPEVLSILQQQLQPLLSLLSTPGKPNQLMVVISGNKPTPNNFDQYQPYIFFDNHFDVAIPNNQLNRVALISLPLYKVFTWNANATPTEAQITRLQKVVDSAHGLGKPIRFWAAPDNPVSWLLQQQVGIDFIGTDRIPQLAEWLKMEE